MKHKLWIALKLLIPILVLIYIEEAIRASLEAFWTRRVLSSFLVFSTGSLAPLLTALASIALTFFFLFVLGNILEFRAVKRAFDRMSLHIPILRYFWSGGEESLAHARLAQPILFQHPIEGIWKLGFIMGNQKIDGQDLLRVFYVTIGDHAFIEKTRTDLYIPLANQPLEAVRCITSFMTSGPKEFFKDDLRM